MEGNVRTWKAGEHNGQPAIVSSRGLVAIFEAGYQSTREEDAKAFSAMLSELDRVTAERDKVTAQRDALAEALRWFTDEHNALRRMADLEGRNPSGHPVEVEPRFYRCPCALCETARAALAVEPKP